jgi:hypothetical protein
MHITKKHKRSKQVKRRVKHVTAKRRRVRSHHRVRSYRNKSRRIRRRNNDYNGEKLVDDSVSVYNKEKDSGNIINGMRDFLHKKSFIM